MSSQAQQTAPEVVPEIAPVEGQIPGVKAPHELSLAELTRIMDVVSALRRERGVAYQQLNLDETKRLLREKLIETARVTGDKVSDLEIDVAIDQYFENLHVFEAPKAGAENFLAHVYVARNTIAKWACGLGMAATLWWSLFSYGVLPGPARTERIAGELYGNIEKSVAAVESMDLVPDVQQRIVELTKQADIYKATGNLKGLERIAAEIAQQEAILKQEYTLQIMQAPVTGIDAYVEESGQLSGYYVIVQAVAKDGTILPMTIRDGETGAVRTVTQWGEQVSQEVYELVAADKRADGVVDARVLGEKKAGELEAQFQTPTGGSLTRGRQITSW